MSINWHGVSKYAILSGNSIQNIEVSQVQGDIGVGFGDLISGFPPGLVQGKIVHGTPEQKYKLFNQLMAVYMEQNLKPATQVVTGFETGQVLIPGVYEIRDHLVLNGSLILDGQSQSKAAFTFKIGGKLTASENFQIQLINGAKVENIIWLVNNLGLIQTPVAALIQTSVYFHGTILTLGGDLVLESQAQTNGLMAIRDNVILNQNQVKAIKSNQSSICILL